MATDGDKTWDAFISHATEDKKAFVRPLVDALVSLGAKVWYDQFTLQPGQSISRSIDDGLANSRFGLVVLSPQFMRKPWPRHELGGLVQRQLAGVGSIIPIWHGVDKPDVLDFSPSLADAMAIKTSEGSASDIAIRILRIIRPDLYALDPRARLAEHPESAALRELQAELDATREHLAIFQCPHCHADLTDSISAPVDEEQKHWDQVDTFQCGYQVFDGRVQHECGNNPRLSPA